jgi:hypothetical protein
MRRHAFRVLALFTLFTLPFVPQARAGGPINSGSTVAGNLAGPGFSETWTFSGTIGDRVVFATATPNGAVGTVMTLKAPGGAAAASGSNRLDFTLTSTGTWSLVVDDLTASVPTTYNISFLDLSGTLTSGSDLDGGAITSGSIKTGTINSSSDLDAFTFTGNIGDHVILAALSTAGNLNTNITLYPPGAGASISTGGNDRLDATLTASGTWTVVVEDLQDLQTGLYSLSLLNLSGPLSSGSDPDTGVITSKQIVNGTTNVVGDFDAYTFHGTIGDRVILLAVATGGPSYTPYIYLYPPGGGTFVNLGGSIDYQLTATGTYTVVVQDQSMLNTGTYALSYLNVTSGPLTSVSDPDGGPIQSAASATGTIGAIGDIDAYTFTGNFGDHVLFAALETSGSLNTNISLYPPGGGPSISISSIDRTDATLNASGTWTIVIDDYSGAATGTYLLSFLNLSGPLTSAGDADGGPITSNQIVTGTTNAVGDFDAYTFSGTSGNRVVMTAQATSGPGYTAQIYLYPPGGGSFVAGSSSGRIDYQLLQSGTYTAVVQDQSLYHTGTYDLSYVNVSAGPFTSVADEDGGPIASGSIKTGTISGPCDLDTYTFQGSSGDHVVLAAVTTSGTLNTEVSVYPPGGGPPIGQTSADRQDIILTADGTWTMVVEDGQDVQSGTYNLSMTDLSGTLTSPGDLDGGPIASNQIFNGTTNAVGDFDAFKITGVAGDRILMMAETTSGPPYHALLWLYPPDGGNAVILSSGLGRLDYQLAESGVYTAVMQDQYLTYTGTYSLSYLNVSAGFLTSGSDPDGSTIKPGDVKTGTINGPGDFDAYWFTGNSGETANINAITTSGTLNTNIAVYPPDGTAAVVNSSSDNASFMLPQTGRYAIVIEDFTDNHTGTYQLTLTGSLTTVGVPVGGPKLLDPTHVVFAPPLPNPARGPATLTFSLPTAQPVELNVYDTRGALVRTLARGTEAPGIYTRNWDGADDRGARVSPGVYFSVLRAGGQTFRRPLVRLE